MQMISDIFWGVISYRLYSITESESTSLINSPCNYENILEEYSSVFFTYGR